MVKFISGILEKVELGATYEDVTYDRWLLLRLANGNLLEISDTYCMHFDLELNQTYQFLLAFAFPRNLQVTSSTDTSLSSTWFGRVAEPKWQIPNLNYRCVRKNLIGQERVLVSTSTGNVLLYPDDIKRQINIGDIVAWEKGEPNLYAIL